MMFTLVLLCSALSYIWKETGAETPNFELQKCAQRAVEVIFGDRDLVFVSNAENHDYLPYNVNNAKQVIGRDRRIVNTTRRVGKSFILQIDTIDSLSEQFHHLRDTSMWHYPHSYTARFLIIIAGSATPKEVFKFVWIYSIIYLAVLVEEDQGVALYTANPHGPGNNCGGVPAVLERQTCPKISDTIPKPLRKYSGCKAVFSITRGDLSLKGNAILSAALLSIAGVTNLTGVHYSFSYKSPIELYNETFLISFARALETLTTYNSMKLSKVFSRHHLVWVVPMPEKISGLEVYFKIFTAEVWVLVALAFALSAWTWWLIRRYQSDSRSNFAYFCLEILSITLWGSSSITPRTRIERWLLIWYIVYSIHLETAYISNLIRVITIPQYQQGIDNLQQLVDSSLPIYISDFFKSLYFNDTLTDHQLYTDVTQKFVIYNIRTYRIITDVVVNRNISAVVSSSMLAQWEAHMGIPVPKYFVDTHISLQVHSVFYSFRHQYFMDTMDKVIERFTQSGIYEKLRKDIDLYNHEMSMTKVIHADVVVLSLGHLYGIFVIFGIGLIVSSVVFLAEIIFERLTRKNAH